MLPKRMIIIKKTELKKVKKCRIQLGVNMMQIVCKDTRNRKDEDNLF